MSTPETSSSSSSISTPSSPTTGSCLKSNQVLIRIYFIDDTHKTLSIDPNNTTGDQLWEMVSEKLGINNKDAECFFIWAQNDEIEWLLYNHQNISETIKNWSTIEKRYCYKEESTSPILSGISSIRGKSSSSSSGSNSNNSSPNFNSNNNNNNLNSSNEKIQSSPSSTGGTIKGFLTLGRKNKINGTGSQSSSSAISTTIAHEHSKATLKTSFPTLGEEGHFRLVYRPTSVLPLDLERSINKAESIHLFYIQAIHNVINSNYPIEDDVALKLASIQLQVLVGDQKMEHQDHFRESINRYIPQHMISKRKPEEWEQLVMPKHALLRGSDSLQLKKAYLETCQRWQYYGSTFFKAKYIPSNTSFFTQEFEGKVSIGVNGNGFHIIDPKAMKIVSYSYRDIVAWDSSSNSFTIKFQMNSNKSESTKNYIFKTPQGELINDLLSDWNHEWEIELKKQQKQKQQQQK